MKRTIGIRLLALIVALLGTVVGCMAQRVNPLTNIDWSKLGKTVANLPVGAQRLDGMLVIVTDANPDCQHGGALSVVICRWNQSSGRWDMLGGQGPTGFTGEIGPIGHSTLISATPESVGANCLGGGTKISVGLDVNDDGVLQTGEATASYYNCNGVTGPNGNPLRDVQVYTSGSGTYLTPGGTTVLHIRMCGGGGGGAGGGEGSGGTGGNNGGNVTLGWSTTQLTAGAGLGGQPGRGMRALSPGGVTNYASLYISSLGHIGTNPGTLATGGGGDGLFGAGGAPGGQGAAGGAGTACSGGSGGWGGTTNPVHGGGGSAGGNLETWITSPPAAMTYNIPAAASGGAAGTNGMVGGAGGSGMIVIEAY